MIPVDQGLWIFGVIASVARLLESLIRRWQRERLERARQMAAENTMRAMEPGSAVIVQQPDGTVSVLVRSPTLGSAAIEEAAR